MILQQNPRAEQRTKRWLGYALALLVCVVVLKAVYLWWVLLSPYGYEPPRELAAISQGEHSVFAFGTLRHDWVRQVVIGTHEPAEPAYLPGYRKDGLNVEHDPDSKVEGVVFVVNHDQLARLDRYERLGIRYERVKKQLSNEDTAWVYQRLMPRLVQNGTP